MENQNLILLAQKVSRSEATTELADYWQKRYELILLKNLFVLSEKTTQQVLNNQIVDRPSTPFGDLVLISHLDANNELDDIRMQSTIETAIRLLDGALDIINFNEEARFVVNQYRKIGLGILDISEFLETKTKTSELDIIDHLGNLISNSSYRASEILAEEKKPCANWTQINKHLRPKSFELWFRENQNEKINGLALTEQYDTDTILETDYQIIPRRNSNLLLLPPDLEWQIWSDRDESSPKTPVMSFIPELPTINLETKYPTENQTETQNQLNLDTDESFVDQLPAEPEKIDTEPFIEALEQEQQQSEPEDDNFSSLIQSQPDIDMSIFETLPEEDLQGHTLLSSDEQNDQSINSEQIPELSTDNHPMLEENQSEMLETTESNMIYEPIPVDQIETSPAIQLLETETPEYLETEVLPLLDTDVETENSEIVENKVNQTFEVGELVKIIRQGDVDYGKIYQILDYLEPVGQGIGRYQLIGGSRDISNMYWSEKDLELVDLDVLLDEINLVKDNDESLENSLISDLELELVESENKITELESQIQDLKSQLQTQTTQNLSEPSQIEAEEVINQYLQSDDFAEIIDARVNQKIQELNLTPKRTQISKASNQTISTLKMMQKYQSK